MSDAKIQLAGGTVFDLLEPDPEMIDIESIAHSLSQLCRFTGHSASFYSVAQHCVVVSRLVPTDLALAGLLHDSAEAFVGDVSSPLKALLPEYKAIEVAILAAIFTRFGIEGGTGFGAAIVKHADLTALATERRDLGLPGNDEYWKNLPEPAPWAIYPLEPRDARVAFLARFAEIVMKPGEGQAPLDGVIAHPEAIKELRQPDPKRFETNEDVSRRLAEAEQGELRDEDWSVVG